MTEETALPALQRLGFYHIDAVKLRRIAMTLHRWHEHECNGTIQRDGPNGDGKPFWYSSNTCRKIAPAPDREKGALKRLEQFKKAYAPLDFYVQGDPRGAALYVIRPGDVPEGKDVDGYYSRGIAVY